MCWRRLNHSWAASPGCLARLAIAIHGVAVLRELRRALVEAGLSPPSRWARSSRALSFVRELGFPDEYAGSPSTDNPHGSKFRARSCLIRFTISRSKSGRTSWASCRKQARRGIVFPPRRGRERLESRSNPLSGDSRTDTCREQYCGSPTGPNFVEQAVQTWTDVWRALGSADGLRVSRLWGKTNSRVAERRGAHHVVVASYQSLSNRLSPQFEWLREAALIVIDEAHGSVAPSFTQILTWLGLRSSHDHATAHRTHRDSVPRTCPRSQRN